MIQVEIFDEYDPHCLINMNSFMLRKEVIDVKMNTVVSDTGDFFTRYLVIYKI